MNLEDFLRHFQMVIYIVVGIVFLSFFFLGFGNAEFQRGRASQAKEDISVISTLFDDYILHGKQIKKGL